MARFVSIWLKSWPLTRLLHTAGRRKDASSVSREIPAAARPLVLAGPGPGGLRIRALSAAAESAGLSIGDLVSNARSKIQTLEVAEADPAADRDALEKLGLWCLRYTPLVMAWDDASGADGLFLEIEGSAHLWGGEAGLLADLAARLDGMGLPHRLALAATPGAAWALARHARRPRIIVPTGRERDALASLPLSALRLPPDTLALARRLGLTRLRDVMAAPRAPLAKRFGAGFLLRLDQAIGAAPEPLRALSAPPVYHVAASFLEPISLDAHIVDAASRLLGDLAGTLARDGMGARRLNLLLFRPDGGTRSLELGLAAPSRDGAHIARLIALRLDRLEGGFEAEFGYEAMALHVLAAEPLLEAQPDLAAKAHAGEAVALSGLIDRLEQRLGDGAVTSFEPHESHIPERAIRRSRAGGADRVPWRSERHPRAARPLLLFPRPETAEVVALIPEGPPRQFRWRGVIHHVTAFEGPERIAPEWWRLETKDAEERDYYAVEDREGRRFWLYRSGRYGGTGITPRWFLHGVFA